MLEEGTVVWGHSPRRWSWGQKPSDGSVKMLRQPSCGRPRGAAAGKALGHGWRSKLERMSGSQLQSKSCPQVHRREVACWPTPS